MEITMKKARDEFAYEIPGLSGDVTHVRKQWNTLKYLDHLGAQTKTNINGWNLDLFRGDGGSIITDRRKINEIFFKFRESLPPETIQTDNILDAVTAKKVDALIKTMAKSAQISLAGEVRREAQNVRTYAEKLQGHKYELFKKKRILEAINAMDAGSGKVYAEVRDLLKDSFYTLDTNQPGNGIAFLTEPITLSHFNSRHGVNHVVQMGRYRVLMTITRYGYVNVTVHHFDKNPIKHEYCHPHLSSGAVCWGNVSNTYHQYSANCEFFQIGMLLKDVLKTYNHDNPYAELYGFFEAYKLGHLTDMGKWPGETPEVSDGDELDRDQDADYPEDEPDDEREDDDSAEEDPD